MCILLAPTAWPWGHQGLYRGLTDIEYNDSLNDEALTVHCQYALGR